MHFPIVTVVTPPAALLDPPAVRSRLGLSATDGADTDLQAYIAAATKELDAPDGWLGAALGRQTLQLSAERFPDTHYSWFHPSQDGSVKLPFPPIVSITSVAYIDQNGAAQTIASSGYSLTGRLLSPVYGTSWPTGRYQPGAVTILYVAGYDAVPEPILQAIVLRVGQLKSMGRSDLMLKQETVIGVGSTQWDAGNFAAYDQAAARLLSGYRVFT